MTTANILMLVMCSPTPEAYMGMMAVTRAYYTHVPNVDVFYYMYSPTQVADVCLAGDVLTFRGEETLVPGCLDKTMRALQYFEPRFDKYRYIFRTNISTIVNVEVFRRTYDVDEHTAPYAYGGPGIAVIAPSWRDPASGIVDGRYTGTKFVGGTCIIMSVHTARTLAASTSIMDRAVVDDVAIGRAVAMVLPDVSLQWFSSANWDVPNFGGDTDRLRTAVVSRAATCAFYRNKNCPDRDVDVQQMKVITQVLQGQLEEGCSAGKEKTDG
jgi:hypothetical protein